MTECYGSLFKLIEELGRIGKEGQVCWVREAGRNRWAMESGVEVDR